MFILIVNKKMLLIFIGGPKLTIKRFDTKPQPLKQVTTTSGLRVGHLVEGPELKATSFPSVPCVNVPKNAFTSLLKNVSFCIM